MTPASIVQKLWNYCNVLRDDGMSYLPALRAQTSGDYVEAAPVRTPQGGIEIHASRGIRTSLFSTVDVFAVSQDVII